MERGSEISTNAGALGSTQQQRSTHLIVCGCSRSGTTMLYNMIRHSAAASVHTEPREISALQTQHFTSHQIATKRPLDIFAIDRVANSLAKFRELLFLVCVRDPRDLVSSLHAYVPNQYFLGYDYQFFATDRHRSYTNPGLGATFAAIENLRDSIHRHYILRYEDIISDPERVRELIAFATGFPLRKSFLEFHESVPPSELTLALNGLRPTEHRVKPAWTEARRLERVVRHLRIFPEIEAIAERWGYPSFQEVCDRYNLALPSIKSESGTIVAFHTDDELYRSEAARFRARMEALGLKHHIVTVPPKSDWVANCAMKPEFLLDVRRQIRGPLLYLDVDAYVHADPWPYLSQYDGDIAAYVSPSGKLLSGSIYLADTRSCVMVLEKWLEEQRQQPGAWDQKVLQTLIDREEKKSGGGKIRFQRLPVNLCGIFDAKKANLHGPTLVEQLQVSRELKKDKPQDMLDRRRRRVAELGGGNSTT